MTRISFRFVASAVLCLLLACPTGLSEARGAAQDVEGIAAEEEGKTKFSLEECINTAIRNNVDLKISRQEYQSSQVEREEAKYQSKKQSDIRSEIRLNSGLDNILTSQIFTFSGAQVEELNPTLKEANELIAKKNLALDEQNLRIDVEKGYFDILKARDNLSNADIELQRAGEQLKNAQVSFEHGIVAKDSVLSAESALAGAQANRTAAEKGLELAKMNLNKLMGRSLTAPIEPTTTFAYEPEDIPDAEEMVKSALALRPEVISAIKAKEVAELNLTLTLKYYAENTFAYRKARIDSEKAALAVRETQDRIALAVHSAYNSVIEAAERLKASQKAKESAQEVYRMTDLRYKSQISTMVEVLQSMENLKQAELSYTSAVFDYNVARAQLDNLAGKGLE